MRRAPPGPYLGFWMRVLAAMLDGVALVAVAIPALLILSGGERLATESVHGPARWLVDWLLPSVYVLGFWLWRAATPGKLAVSAAIADARTGARPRPLRLLVRYLAYAVSALPFGLGFVWIAFDGRKQGWHDKLAGTVVLRRPDPETEG